MAAILVAGFAPPYWPERVERPFALGGSAAAVVGALVAYVSARALGRALTPFPRPKRGSDLVVRGPYRIVRHPIYAAGILFFLGYSLFASMPALALTLVLVVLWAHKARVEEEWLAESYPEYYAYRALTRFRFVPGIY